jgi:adenosylmethionine-8-amino-7-oxononanoate aminotransferase
MRVFRKPHINQATENLATLLLFSKQGGLPMAIFFNSGNEVTDAALKLAVQYWHG